jgi:hypothetical protein
MRRKHRNREMRRQISPALSKFMVPKKGQTKKRKRNKNTQHSKIGIKRKSQ